MILERGDELFIPDLVSVFPETVFTLRRTELTWKIRARTRFGDWSRTEPRGCSRFKAKLISQPEAGRDTLRSEVRF